MAEETIRPEITRKEILFNRQVNYIVIEKMWEIHNRGKDKVNLYNLLGLKKNQYSRIRTADTVYGVDLEDMWEKKNLKVLGLSKDIMIGTKMIEIEGVTKEEWKKYLKLRYIDKDAYVRTDDMQDFTRKLRKIFNSMKADVLDDRDIARLYYYFKNDRPATYDLPDMEMRELYSALKRVTVHKMKSCDGELRKQVLEELKEKYKKLNIIVGYENLG